MNVSEMQDRIIELIQKKNQTITGERIHIFPFNHYEPMAGKVNIAWCNDIRVKQFAMSGYMPGFFEDAARYLKLDRAKFAKTDVIITLNESMYNEIQTWLGCGKKTEYLQFMSYPTDLHVNGQRRPEIAYIDNSRTYIPEFWTGLLTLFADIRDMFGIASVIVPTYPEITAAVNDSPYIGDTRVLARSDYDYLSRWGILVNVHNFAQAGECLPRKLALYLNAGMTPLVHDSFVESIKYLEQNLVEPYTYRDMTTLGARLTQRPSKHEPEYFSMESRIPALLNVLEQLEHPPHLK